jgi:hypothetical protein
VVVVPLSLCLAYTSAFGFAFVLLVRADCGVGVGAGATNFMGGAPNPLERDRPPQLPKFLWPIPRDLPLHVTSRVFSHGLRATHGSPPRALWKFPTKTSLVSYWLRGLRGLQVFLLPLIILRNGS